MAVVFIPLDFHDVKIYILKVARGVMTGVIETTDSTRNDHRHYTPAAGHWRTAPAGIILRKLP